VHFDGHQVVCTDDTKESTSPRKDTTTFVDPLGADNNEDHSTGNYECCNTRSSSLYSMEMPENEPVDFKNNSSLWVPPEPEDEEDDHDGVLCGDDDEGRMQRESGDIYAQATLAMSIVEVEINQLRNTRKP
jgi:1-phosphatidylinositol-3-phosphate 5-kinase